MKGKATQSENADSPRVETWQCRSNVTAERPLQYEKHFGAIVSIDEGMQIDLNDAKFENAASPRTEDWHPHSKATASA
jgi:hypothetical protein